MKMTINEFVTFCEKLNFDVHVRATDPTLQRKGITHTLAIYGPNGLTMPNGSPEIRHICSINVRDDGVTERDRDAMEWRAGVRRALPGSKYERELIAAGESLYRE